MRFPFSLSAFTSAKFATSAFIKRGLLSLSATKGATTRLSSSTAPALSNAPLMMLPPSKSKVSHPMIFFNQEFEPQHLFICNNFAIPIKNASKLHDICVAQLHQLLGCIFTAAAATAVHHNELILVGQFSNFSCANGFIGHIDGVRNVTCGKLIGTAHVENDIAGFLCHHGHRFFHTDLSVGAVRGIACAGASGKHQGR